MNLLKKRVTSIALITAAALTAAWASQQGESRVRALQETQAEAVIATSKATHKVATNATPKRHHHASYQRSPIL